MTSCEVCSGAGLRLPVLVLILEYLVQLVEPRMMTRLYRPSRFFLVGRQVVVHHGENPQAEAQSVWTLFLGIPG